MTAPTTQKRIIFVGTYADLFHALAQATQSYPPALLEARREAVLDALHEAEAEEEDRRVIDALNEVYDDVVTEKEAAEYYEDLNREFGCPEPPAAGDCTSLAYGDNELQPFNPLDHVPADPSEMYQSGWVCNSIRAQIKDAYEKKLHKEYNALWVKG